MNDYVEMINEVITKMRTDYALFTIRSEYGSTKDFDEAFAQTEGMYVVSTGRSYDKIIRTDEDGSHRSVAGFVCRKDSKKFKTGDLLMAASWSGPATNFARGNIFDNMPNSIRWTGIA